MQQAIHIPINSLQHIGIPVTNIKISEAFYERLGFNNVMQSPFLNNGETGTCIMMQRDAMIIEIYQMPEAQLADIRSRKNGHIDHIAFDISDVDATFALLKKRRFQCAGRSACISFVLEKRL